MFSQMEKCESSKMGVRPDIGIEKKMKAEKKGK